MTCDSKISKSDLRHDLEHPEKHNIFFDQIDRFSLIAPEYVLDAEYKSMIPPKWGIVAVSRGKDKDGKDCLLWKNVRRPMALVDDAQTHRTFNRAFAASIIRRCVSTVQAEANAERDRIRTEAYRQGQATRGGTDWEKLYREASDELEWMRKFCWACGLYDRDEKRIKRLTRLITAAKDASSGTYFLETAAERLKGHADAAVKAAKTLRLAIEQEAKEQKQQANAEEPTQKEDK